MSDRKMTLYRRLSQMVWDFAHAARKWYWRTFKIKTRGVRVAVLRPASGAADGEEILLVRHPYGELWVMPGGGVGRREPPWAAAEREIFEEAGLKPQGDLVELGTFRNSAEGKRDTVTVFVADGAEGAVAGPSFEVSRLDWFPTWALPEGTSSATRRRIAQIEAWRRGELELPISEVGEW